MLDQYFEPVKVLRFNWSVQRGRGAGHIVSGVAIANLSHVAHNLPPCSCFRVVEGHPMPQLSSQPLNLTIAAW
jgi:hypothetical protein